MFAAHDSMTNALTWVLNDLAHHPKDQRVRGEIARVKAAIATPDELTAPELESMEFTNAVIHESLGLHPAVFALPRTAAEEDIIPLATPIRTTDGSYTSEIFQIMLATSYCSSRRLKSVWGCHANELNPERFNDPFRILELQATLTALIDKFDFSPVPGVEIIGAPAGSMIPIVKGRAHEGPQVPFHVSVRK
ncbi:cytochrome P450 [Panaeolus papilionaceus]|nr:cytochrome P450 [Panaeolus papilionaceus]